MRTRSAGVTIVVMISVTGTWRGRLVRLEWREGKISGDHDLRREIAPLRGRVASYEFVLRAATRLADDDAFRLRGEVPRFDEMAVERRFRAIWN